MTYPTPTFASESIVGVAFASLPSASSVTPGTIQYVSDTGNNSNGSMWFSDGTTWRPVAGSVPILQFAVPVGIPSSGTVGSNGALTLTTALSTTYGPSGSAPVAGAYFYFPASAVYSSSPAGFYWTVMTSTTAGTVYNNTISAGLPTPPASPTPIVGTGAAYTQTTGSLLTPVGISLAGGAMALNGALDGDYTWLSNSSANNKSARWQYGGQYIINPTNSGSNDDVRGVFRMQNRGVANAQVGFAVGNIQGLGTDSGTPSYFSVNSAAAQSITLGLVIFTATDWVIVESASIRLIGS
jgi:hypothetical protein